MNRGVLGLTFMLIEKSCYLRNTGFDLQVSLV